MLLASGIITDDEALTLSAGRISGFATGRAVAVASLFAGLGGAAAALSIGLSFSSPRNCSSSFPTIAVRITVIQMGSAARAPVSFSPSDSLLSYPTHTPHVTDGENPRNHASV